MTDQINQKRSINFYRLVLTTLILTYFLILVGGVVRTTGAGMGCPDWPKCFGNWVPPTSASELPEGYEQDLVEQRLDKNQKFANYLNFLGFNSKAEQILNDPAVKEVHQFNVVKTWTEYVNRLIGAIVGFAVFLCFAFAWPYRKRDPKAPWIGFLILLFTGFQGWIGSIVVSTNLLDWMISLHMLIALAIIGMLTYWLGRITVKNGIKKKVPVNIGAINVVWTIAFILLMAQIILGTQVRDGIDEVMKNMSVSRNDWVDQLGFTFDIHRSFSTLVLLAHFYLLYLIYKKPGNINSVLTQSLTICILLIIEVSFGITLAYFGFPKYAQPLHLIASAVLIGFLLNLLFDLNPKLYGSYKN